MDNYSNGLTPTDLAYDLRQSYAKIVGEHLLDVAEARKADNFFTWYKALEDLHTIIRHKFKKKEDEDGYKEVKAKITKLANEHKTAWLGKSMDPVERNKLEEALRELEEYLYAQMSKAKMFGEGGKIAGL